MSGKTELFLVAGEVSGDIHGAELLQALANKRGDLVIRGLGGPQMQANFPDIDNWLADAAVLGFVEVLRKYRYFRDKLVTIGAQIIHSNPAAVILIDYPGFNLRLAKRLRDQGYGGKLIYYISPQVWAWKKGRIETMAKLLDLMICIFPFEKDLYEKSGLKTVFSGHPLIDKFAERRANAPKRDANLVALLPGSREREIEALFPIMLASARILSRDRPELRFATAGASPELTEMLSGQVSDAGLTDVVSAGELDSYDIMQRSAVGVVASGTATLEAAALGLPYCLIYKVAWLTAWVARTVLKVKFLGIVNVIAGREVVREMLQESAKPEALAAELGRLLDDEVSRSDLLRDLEEVIETLGEGGAHQRAADAVVSELELLP
ncbi:MAG: lipid-A-disaccharide synthase [Verrucomicrobiota bacterium]